ncbi:MAG TPA: hypothetical protein VMB05_00250 [Solirubrobacteraceae bacterium]|nr:hypothetical protein [Solirubrobacteraceae bacterium]
MFLFTDQEQGLRHGYLYDGQHSDGFYHYTGEGQFGDQKMAQGNRAIKDHAAEGRELHLFDAGGGSATYLGQFQYIDHYTADAPETGDGPMRSVLVFRLQPIGETVGLAPSRLENISPELIKEVSVEQHLTERMMIEPNREPYVVERREQHLVRSYMAQLIARGHDVCRLQLRPAGERAPLFCDLYDRSTNTLIEAKGSTARSAFRMAIGQLADYARLIDPSPGRVILVPDRPRDDLLRLADSQGIAVIWRDGEDQFQSAYPAAEAIENSRVG